jgi:DNA-binding protein HU-beta
MSKKDLVAALAERCELTQTKANDVVDHLFKYIEQSMQKSEEVSIPGFGKFKVSVRPARKARNPQTGKEMQLPKTNVPKFTASKTLKDGLNA